MGKLKVVMLPLFMLLGACAGGEDGLGEDATKSDFKVYEAKNLGLACETHAECGSTDRAVENARNGIRDWIGLPYCSYAGFCIQECEGLCPGTDTMCVEAPSLTQKGICAHRSLPPSECEADGELPVQCCEASGRYLSFQGVGSVYAEYTEFDWWAEREQRSRFLGDSTAAADSAEVCTMKMIGERRLFSPYDDCQCSRAIP